MSKDDYIKLISSNSSRYGDKLLELMEKYNKNNLRDITPEEEKEFWDMLKFDKEITIENSMEWEIKFDRELRLEVKQLIDLTEELIKYLSKKITKKEKIFEIELQGKVADYSLIINHGKRKLITVMEVLEQW